MVVAETILLWFGVFILGYIALIIIARICAMLFCGAAALLIIVANYIEKRGK